MFVILNDDIMYITFLFSIIYVYINIYYIIDF